MNKLIKRSARKAAERRHGTADGHAAVVTMMTWEEACKWMARQCAEIAVEEAQNHTRGAYFQLGTNIANRILMFGGEDVVRAPLALEDSR